MEAAVAGSEAAAVLGDASLALCLRVLLFEAGASGGASRFRAWSSLLPLGAFACAALLPASHCHDLTAGWEGN